MQSLIIVSKEIEKRNQWLEKYCLENKIDRFDINIVESEKAIGIENIRDFQKKIYFKARKNKKIVILKIDTGISQDAQNALLKVLEEPPDDTTIIISAFNEELLLATILSRCTLTKLDTKPQELSKKETEDFFETLSLILSSKTGERMKFAQDYSKNKEEALIWLEKMIISMRKILVENHFNNSNYLSGKKPLVEILKLMQEARQNISSTNVSPRFILENLFLNL